MSEQLAGYETVRINGGAIMPTCIKTDSNYAGLINKLEDLLDIHRAKAHICCDETCPCWDIEEILIKERA